MLRRRPDVAVMCVGIAMLVAAVVAMFLGWWGVSSTRLIHEQLPYLVSGSACGLALLVAGIALLRLGVERTIAARQLEELDGILDEVHRLAELLASDGSSPASIDQEERQVG